MVDGRHQTVRSVVEVVVVGLCDRDAALGTVTVTDSVRAGHGLG